MEKDQSVAIKWAVRIGSPRLRETFHLPDPIPTLFPCCVCLSCNQVTGYAAIWHRVTVPFFFPTRPLAENTRLGTCCDWKPSTSSFVWGSDPALCWEPGSSLKKHLNSLLGSGCSGHRRRWTHVLMKAQQSRRGRKIHRTPGLISHFSEWVLKWWSID